ncbi:4a-hydroxytetrahydrobiopterin dehydratase [Algiphilus sp. W345]|uniref:Putative pterin-4-alpha-carbinolamine dehydratase n=1 Tax=Banduia mediterranea TaxID=3075609 RepID=A0ABU2WEL5_9GAMM|nr:4a-hydroxytetrahydrobiopterin dehydratase [Algiphilus sp. W345]MDT0496313.1 4a-hydroxytetrahydrobiopterin dehydratase [Algiphilus sp. W345]
MTELVQRRCVPCEGGTQPLSHADAGVLMKKLRANWTLADDASYIEAHFEFKNYWRTTAFINAVIWIAHSEDHHPDIQFGYKTCSIRYSTHAANGLTENDFICAAKVDALNRD